MMLRTLLASIAVSFVLASTARAQVVITSSDGEVVFQGEDESVMQEAPPEPDAVPAEAKKAHGPRLDKLKKLDFDRRASTILSTWSNPPKAEDKDKDKEDTQTASADKDASKSDAATPAAEKPAEAAQAAGKPAAAPAEPETPEAAQKRKEAEEATRKKAEEAAAQKKKAEEEAARKAAEAKALELEMSAFQRNVTLSDWAAVKTYLASLTDDEKKVAYDRLLQSLQKGPQNKPNVPPMGQQFLEKNQFSPEDVLGIVSAAPLPLSKENLKLLGQILRQSLDQGHQMEGFLALVRPHLGVETIPEPTPKEVASKDAASKTGSKDAAAEDSASKPAASQPASSKDSAPKAPASSGAALQHPASKDAASKEPASKDAGSNPGAAQDPDVVLTKRQLCLILSGANEQLFLGEFLPTPQEAETKGDREGLNLISRHCLAQYEKDKKTSWLEQAWRATQAVLAVGEVSEDDKKEALTRAVDIAPRIQKELGQTWLDESFTERPERGMEILSAIGTAASTALQTLPQDAEKRFKLLELQTTAATALLKAAPDRATQWKAELEVLGSNWLREALVTYQYDDSTSLGPRMQRDNYGNIFYWEDSGQQYRNQGVKSLRTKQVLDIRPTDEWLSRLDAALQPRFYMVFAQLLLKVGEEEQAFPFIEKLAATHPRQAKDLVDEFLRVWAKNHDPNSDRGRTNRYMFMYGFEERANGIPLTRSKQDRNLKELGEWVGRVRNLHVDVDPDLLANAFVAAHSTAEVYRLETIEQIFGPLADLQPSMLATLVEKMRANLATVWRDPALQKDKKTNRGEKDIQAEVLHGYDLAYSTVDRALEKHADSWELWLVKAAIEHDENDFRHEISKDPDFSTRRQAAFETFHKAAALYGAQVGALDQEKETTRVYETWFYAALGACDLKAITHDSQLAAQEIPLVKAAIESLPGERAARHMSMFANALVTRTSNAAPAIKFRYVREGLAIAGDDPMAHEAKAVFDYYSDLVTEIQLRASLDGSDHVGHDKPFGVAVDIRHTKEIERESGGFSKYLQNQNTANFAYNYGRPLEDYRDKFEEAARAALQENFDVLSVTFNDPQARSKAEPQYGWRRTPYAYLLLKAKGPQVDRIPPLELDLDFLDTSGYAVVPVTSAPIVIDAGGDAGDERPYSKLALTQTIDERQAKDQKLILEVKATALGLVPALEALIDVAPQGFEVAKRDDHGVSVTKFDDDGDAMVTERTWTITLKPKEGLATLPTTFTFATPKVETATNERFRYVDADLAAVPAVVDLESRYGKMRASRLWWMIPVALLIAAAGVVAWKRWRTPQVSAQKRFQVPEPLTPFTVLGLLRDIENRNGLGREQQREIDADIEQLELHYFGETAGAAPDLERIATSWVARAR